MKNNTQSIETRVYIRFSVKCLSFSVRWREKMRPVYEKTHISIKRCEFFFLVRCDIRVGPQYFNDSSVDESFNLHDGTFFVCSLGLHSAHQSLINTNNDRKMRTVCTWQSPAAPTATETHAFAPLIFDSQKASNQFIEAQSNNQCRAIRIVCHAITHSTASNLDKFVRWLLFFLRFGFVFDLFLFVGSFFVDAIFSSLFRSFFSRWTIISGMAGVAGDIHVPNLKNNRKNK